LTEQEIEEDEDDALLTTLAPGGEIEAREAHHTEAQIAVSLNPKYGLKLINDPKAKKAAAAKKVGREAHHTEAQIAVSILTKVHLNVSKP
jgi:hypothetical protein